MRTKHTFFAEREEREAQFSVQTWTVIGPFVLLLATLKSSMFEDESRNLYEYRVIWYVAEFGLIVTLWYTVYKIAHVWYIRKYNLMYIPKPEILFEEKLPPEYSDTEPKEKSTIACQTESRNHPEEAEKLKTRYNKEIRTINREMRMMKRRYSEKVSKARYRVKTTDAQLSNLQLKVPQLLKEKSSLEDEKEAIEKQLQEERQRHQELRSKFNKLHNQMANPLITGRNYINYH
ncbi:uncharacterized protein LOC132557103 [Ylistrum balloti]|uniref:uncharacterized protein LOC132557103 n=1 Tax=Ylistrum balloti TaxID=509963 RepID=UPI002905B4D1|nr:uncharacterized protein LOC132557103 [Ylistrum balloti]